MAPCVVFEQAAPEHTEFTLFISFSGEVVGILSKRRVSPGPSTGGCAKVFFPLTDAAAPPFAGNVPFNSMREKQLVSFKAPERTSPAVRHTAKSSGARN